MNEIDKFVNDNVAPELRDVANMLRDLMRELAPKAPEEIAVEAGCDFVIAPGVEAGGHVAELCALV
ncbi:MAG: hypothetical protein WEB06_11930 [Actinomycetota bacterium]